VSINEAQLIELIKGAVAEVLFERRDFLKEILEEILDEIALSRAIDEGMDTQTVSRDVVLAAL
jgi:hypothetical protein